MLSPTTSGQYFEDIEVGMRWKAPSFAISEASIIDFAREWDPHSFHVDKTAAESSIFGKLCASGIHTLSHTYKTFMGIGVFHENIMGGTGIDDLRFMQPVFPDEEILVEAIVEGTEVLRRPDRGLVKVRLEGRKLDGKVALSYVLNMLVRRKPVE